MLCTESYRLECIGEPYWIGILESDIGVRCIGGQRSRQRGGEAAPRFYCRSCQLPRLRFLRANKNIAEEYTDF